MILLLFVGLCGVMRVMDAAMHRMEWWSGLLAWVSGGLDGRFRRGRLECSLGWGWWRGVITIIGYHSTHFTLLTTLFASAISRNPITPFPS